LLHFIIFNKHYFTLLFESSSIINQWNTYLVRRLDFFLRQTNAKVVMCLFKFIKFFTFFACSCRLSK